MASKGRADSVAAAAAAVEVHVEQTAICALVLSSMNSS